MIYVKAIGFGLLFAIVAVVLSVLVFFLAGTLYWWLIELPRFQSGNEGIDFAGGTVMGFRVAPLIVVAAVAFVSGVWWVLRRRTHINQIS